MEEKTNGLGCTIPSSVEFELDQVDKLLEVEDGKIERKHDPILCHHGPRQKCTHCLPVDPFDGSYLSERDIKHMSFHANLRKVNEYRGKGKGAAIKYPLENTICHVNLDCKDHKPYPEGICTKCRPSTVTLSRQLYRHVDNISFENDLLVNRFLDFWRGSLHQRIGYLLGRYEIHTDVPLGIRAVVAAIYEPPQDSTESSVYLSEDPNSQLVQNLCKQLGLQRIGWIFSDLTPVIDKQGLVMCSRDEDSYLMSGEECITAGWLQNSYPNPCKWAYEGYFGSKFVTVIASGDKTQQIHFSGYQVSNQCAALVEDNLLLPIRGYPELAYARDVPLNDKHYIPDVQYAEKDQYGNQVCKDGRPLPVEYLLVDVPAGMPKEPEFTFVADTNFNSFPVENRMGIGELQNFTALQKYKAQFSKNQFLEMASDFHFLYFLLTNDMCHFTQESLSDLLAAVRNKDRIKAFDWANTNHQWATVETLLAAHSGDLSPSATPRGGMPSSVPMEEAVGGAEVSKWSCNHCTFENNQNRTDCEMCGLPR